MRYSQDTERYIKILNTALIPLINFDSVSYLQEPATSAEIVKVQDTLGNSHFIDVTGFDLERILLDVFAVAIGNSPKSVIKDVNKRRKYAAFFTEAK